MDSNKVKQLIDEAIAENPSLFLIDWKITPDDKIIILADGDEGLSVEEIVRISRHVEHNLDREECDFALEVSSPGVGSELTMPRQFVKNVGRTLEATLIDKVIEGEIVEADDEGVTVFWEAREPKPLGKGKITVEHEEKINYADIKKAIIKVTF
ncbi:ribosome assembly cofactor RimP [Empedobacter falsenii]|uniref:Ribosome maturation factor RimP n=2 Tax=Empedobacter TaxID=59734 RepID=A0ABY8V8P5_9FLAO|nr:MULTISPECIES: ribosome assembly cofactor RimP [Empedobacter]MCA4776919.1 ribosome assembly cofactor RimP [Empedobacter stercoris]MCA4810194.1 ribosome assembly cofactor RimP [Empedobacter stercoris]MDM1522589.1 ribosome assembly cofactor RimP [Empedobacter sp. 225-1]MDM1543377.1 ribosome assembly cofactor RimP [Empedobacter sp. 189-2]NOJ76061.1 ribosome assembly cofactor RimP [Empedobacter stercoris]